MELEYFTVDAFTAQVFQGTPVLVFPQADDVTDDMMSKISAEFGFPDTVFVTKSTSPAAVATFRYFTKVGETAFEGHATIGAAYVLNAIESKASAQPIRRFTLDIKSGAIDIVVTNDGKSGVITEFILTTSTKVDNYIPSLQDLAKIFSVDQEGLRCDAFMPLVALGDRPYFIVPMTHRDTLLRAEYSQSAWVSSAATSTLPKDILVFAPAVNNSKHHFIARLMGASIAPGEDPPIGSAMPAFATYLVVSDTSQKDFVIERGAGRSRLSVLNVHIDNVTAERATVRVGGSAVITGQGKLRL